MANKPKFLICENPMAEYGQEYILHTQKPRVLFKVIPDGNSYEFEIVEEFDQLSEFPPEKIAGLIRRLSDWFISYCKWEEEENVDQNDEDDDNTEDEESEDEVKYPILEDAHAMSLMHNSTFKVPSNEELSKLKLGDLVKVNASGERFWVKIVFMGRTPSFLGIVDNALVNTSEHGLKADDCIFFKVNNIYQIYKHDN